MSSYFLISGAGLRTSDLRVMSPRIPPAVLEASELHEVVVRVGG